MPSIPQSTSPRTLQVARILDAVGGDVPKGLRLEIEPQLDSTNETLKRRSSTEDIHWLALLAEQQTAGRGRLGRSWISPPGSNLYLSLGWRFNYDVSGLAGLSLAVGCAVAEQLESSFGVHMMLKWPNDLYLDSRKCGGVLIDLVPSPTDGWVAIIGIGLNVAMPMEDSHGIDQPWTDLASHLPAAPSRDAVAADVLAALVRVLSGWQAHPFSAWQACWQRRDFLKGHEVTVQQAGNTIRGRASGVDGTGALSIETDLGTVSVHAGEASMLRGVAP